MRVAHRRGDALMPHATPILRTAAAMAAVSMPDGKTMDRCRWTGDDTNRYGKLRIGRSGGVRCR
jgi:hypothetical protein